MDYFDFVTKMLVIAMPVGIAGWALKNYIAERTKPAEKIDPKDVLVTVGTMEEHCKKRSEEYEKMQTKNLDHAVELIQQDLKHGQKKFDLFGKTIEGLTKSVSDMTTSIALLNKEIKAANSNSKKKEHAARD